MYPSSLIRHKSKYSIIFLLLQSLSNGDTEAGALMFVFYFDEVPTLAMLELMCFCVCVCVCVCVRVTRSLQLFPYTSRINFNTYRLNNASLYKGLLLFVYTHNENKTLWFYKVQKTNRMLLSAI